MNFKIIPNGEDLKHSQLTDYNIRFFAPGCIEKGYKCCNKTLFSYIGGFPYYGMDITLDSAPNPLIDKFDLYIYDDSFKCVQMIENAIERQNEKLSFIPPHGVPYGTTHFILTHNKVPYIHLQCSRAKRMGTLKAEYITPKSFYWYLSICKTFSLYGCKTIKNNIYKIISNPEKTSPKTLCIIDDYKGYYGFYNIASQIIDDLYDGYEGIYLTDEQYEDEEENKINGNSSKPYLFVWDLKRTDQKHWTHRVEYIKKNFDDNTTLIIYGSSQDVNTLFEKFKELLKLIPAKNRWSTEPYSIIEKVYCEISRQSDEAIMPNYENFEYLYKYYSSIKE
ncbi:MAG: hypothetical protein IJ413_11670 [Bacteroides sp.]|nr:hypothetical protein [Bacteroides sp.]